MTASGDTQNRLPKHASIITPFFAKPVTVASPADFPTFQAIDFTAVVLVSRAGLEPATTALKVRCSTN